MEYAGLDFVDAVADLAARVGMAIPDSVGTNSRRRETDTDALLTVMANAWRYYKTALKSSERAVAYLKGRGLTGEVAARYGLGYAPDEWRNLAACFAHYEDPVLVRAGLVIDTEGGRRYDRFRDRIMFPIFSGRGRVIAFGGRVLDKGEPKYLNSPETPLFAKGTELYGLVQARQAIRDSGRVLVVEGYMDVIALAQHGVGYAVATLGTAVSGTQIRKLIRMAERVVFAFDGDDAGRKAAVRALEQSLPLFEDGKRLDFLFLPSGEDPDSYIRQHGCSRFEALLEAALPLSEFFTRELLGRTEVSSVEGKARLMQIASPWLKEIHAPFLGHLLRRRIAELAGLSDREAGRLLGRAPAPQPAGKRHALPLPSPARTLLLCLLAKPELAARIDRGLLLEGDAYASALRGLLEFAEKAPNLRTARDMAEVLGDTPEGDLVRQAAGEVMTWPEDYDVMADLEGALSSLHSEAGRRMGRQIESRKPSELSAEEKAAYLGSLRRRKNSTFSGGQGGENEPSDQ
jgi:DNA primase